ncbi:MAG: hypothetical protein JOZ98_16630, partial [Solirubrobacterales bacterium]|nr:hypothetical protein [Solirubrobacterales bacterium]
GGAGAAAATIATMSDTARAASPLDASFTSPYPPHPALRHPSSWFVYTALIPGVIMPYDTIVSNRHLGPLPNIEGNPDLRALPSDTTMLLIYHWDPVPVATANLSASPIQLSAGATALFSQFGGGTVNWFGFRQFLGNYIAVQGDTLYSLDIRVYVGPDSGPEWSDVQPVVDSMQVPV